MSLMRSRLLQPLLNDFRVSPFRSLLHELERPLFADIQPFAQYGPAVDVQETKTEFHIKADIPGFKKDQIEVNAEGNVLNIKGFYENVNEDQSEGQQHQKERIQQSFQRSFTLPTKITTENIIAKLEDGVLKLTIPKAEVPEPKKIEIQ